MTSPDPMITAAAEAIEDVMIRRLGRDLGTIHRDEIVSAAVAAALRVMADEIDRGPTFSIPPSVISTLVRERADRCVSAEQPGSDRGTD